MRINCNFVATVGLTNDLPCLIHNLRVVSKQIRRKKILTLHTRVGYVTRRQANTIRICFQYSVNSFFSTISGALSFFLHICVSNTVTNANLAFY